MELYGIGNAVLYYREKNNLSQQQLCAGICSEMTLSRIETGIREFDSLISATLMERLGKSTNHFEFVLNAEDYSLCQLREKITAAINSGDIRNARAYCSSYTKQMPDENLHRQFVLFHEALCMIREEDDVNAIVEKLYEAIRLTRADFEEKTDRVRLYSAIEVKIIYQLFRYERISEDVFESVLRFIDKLYDEENKRELLPPFLIRLAKKHEDEEN